MTSRINTRFEPYDRKVDGVLANLSVDPKRAPRPSTPRKVMRDITAIFAALPDNKLIERTRSERNGHRYVYPEGFDLSPVNAARAR